MSNHNSNIIVSTINVSTIIIFTSILFRSVLHSVGQGFKCMLEAPQAQVSREKKSDCKDDDSGDIDSGYNDSAYNDSAIQLKTELILLLRHICGESIKIHP